MDTFLRWAGSKRKLLPTLLKVIPADFNRYVEPFAGSACVFFALTPGSAVLGDINEDLINAYEQIKERVKDVIASLAQFSTTDRDNAEENYYRVRSLEQSGMSDPERAARFIFLNRYCFNGLYRTNKRGQFNVPFGGDKSGLLPAAEELRSIAVALQTVRLVAGSFEATLSEVGTGDFCYIDPPYSIRARRVFNSYSHFGFGEHELSVLRLNLERLDRDGIPFLLSYGLSREAMVLSAGFRSRHLVVKRQIAGFAAKRRNSRELLITNY